MTQLSPTTRSSSLRVFSASLLSALLIMMPFVQLAAAEKRYVAMRQKSAPQGTEIGSQKPETKSARSGAENLFVNPPVVAGPITATKTDSYTSAPGSAAPGDTISYTVDVANTGLVDAAAVAFADTIDANTTLVPGSVKASPVAINDTYSAVKNTPLNVAAPGVLSNDSGLPSPVATAIAGGPTTAGGTITLNADGSFTYTAPNASFTGPDTFTYTITNGQTPPNPGVDNVATVTINVDAAPEVSSTTPTNGATDRTTDTNISVTFSEAVNLTGSWFTISCTTSGAHTAVVTGGPTTFTLNPDTDFTQGETCTVTVVAAQVADQDSNDPPDNMVADYVFSFTMDAAPSVTTTTPTNGATNVATNSAVTVNFSESVNATTSSFTISCATSGAHAYTLSSSPNNTFTLTPTVAFAGGELCTVTVVAAQVSDTDANDPPNNMVANYVFSFTTDAAPTVTATTPTSGATNQPTNTDITLTFSESVSLGATPVTISCTTSGAHTSVVSASPNTSFTVNPDVDFAGGETCTVTVLAAQVTDTDAGDPPDNMAANYVFSFSTDAAPSVTTVTPTNGSTQVASNTNIVVNFSEPVNIVDATAFTVECPGGSPVAFSVTPAAPGATNSFTIDPTSDLPFNTICTVTVVASKVTDTDANDPPDNMAANFVFSFTVDAVPTVTTTTPTNSSLSNLKTTNVTVNFSENVGVTAGGVTINCGAGNIAFTGLPQTNVASIVLDPTGDLPPGSTCTVTVLSANVTDSDAGDPPNNLDGDNNGTEGGNYVFTFGVAPDAVNDAYNATGNVGIVIAANGVLANDVGPGAVVDRVGPTTANNVVPGGGSFTSATANGGR